MLFIITEHTTCNVCEEEMRGGGRGGQIGQGWKVISLLLFLLVLEMEKNCPINFWHFTFKLKLLSEPIPGCVQLRTGREQDNKKGGEMLPRCGKNWILTIFRWWSLKLLTDLTGIKVKHLSPLPLREHPAGPPDHSWLTHNHHSSDPIQWKLQTGSPPQNNHTDAKTNFPLSRRSINPGHKPTPRNNLVQWTCHSILSGSPEY